MKQTDADMSSGVGAGYVPVKPGMSRSEEVDDLLMEIRSLIIPFIAQADVENPLTIGALDSQPTLLEEHTPEDLQTLLNIHLPQKGVGKVGLLELVERILQYSVNTWDRGFMHKLSGATNAVGVISELVLAVLNANVSPVLTSIEKTTARTLAALFGLTGPFAGGVTQPGGSASNATALVVARNELFAETKQSGYGGKKFVLFTSAHCHYSLQKAAQICGFGSSNARSVPVDEQGRMRVDKLREMIREARHEGYTPFFVNATAGTTVLGAFDPLVEIARVCREEKLWFHIDASWGGSAIFSSMHKHKMRGSELADSLTINPHKMMGVPVTCSFLLTSDTRRFWRANTLPAGYLFHGNDVPESGPQQDRSKCSTDGDEHAENAFWDLADLTLQCGRKGDSLKLALAWVYYGRLGFENQIDHAFHMAAYFASLIAVHVDLVLISENPPPCLQVCFYYARGSTLDADEAVNSRRTQEIARGLVSRGFMVDYAPGDRGFFLRPVIHLMTTKSTVEGLLKAVVELGNSIR